MRIEASDHPRSRRTGRKLVDNLMIIFVLGACLMLMQLLTLVHEQRPTANNAYGPPKKEDTMRTAPKDHALAGNVGQQQQRKKGAGKEYGGDIEGGIHRRSKAHFCYSRVHGLIGTKLLLEEFNFQPVDATGDEEWDLIYGGYPHCGKHSTDLFTWNENEFHMVMQRPRPQDWDWEMQSGLNRKLTERGWANLKPHQAYHPCMGCKHSYCQKRELCRILRSINPEHCYILPEDLDRLRSAMDGIHPWVLKKDGGNVHIHEGRGVWMIKSPEQLPPPEELSRGMHLVQPWNEPFLGDGMFRRKSEFKIYVAVTSVYPLRAYAHKEKQVTIAAKEYTNATDAMMDKCMYDTHSNTRGCKLPADVSKALESIFFSERLMSFDNYVKRVGMCESQWTKLVNDTLQLISTVMKIGHSALENHHTNQGINESGAMCFSHMRVDIGINSEGKPYIFEMAEFPGLWIESEEELGPTRDLFHMIGLDQDPVPVEKRAEFEKHHLGGWELLPDMN